MYNKVEICGINTTKLKTLTTEEKKELLIRASKGDQKAREELIMGNLRLVLSVIQKFNSRGENPDDLFQVGCVGLIKAVDNFDVSQNVLFSTYAVPMNVFGRKKAVLHRHGFKTILLQSFQFLLPYKESHKQAPLRVPLPFALQVLLPYKCCRMQ